MSDTCGWHIEDADNGCWETSCGHLFALNDGSPYQNRMRFCCYCGRRLVERLEGAMRHTLVVMLQIETNDDRLSPERISVETAAETAALRVAVLANLKRITRVIAAMPVEQAKAMMMLHEATAVMLLGEQIADRPPSDYVPPTRD